MIVYAAGVVLAMTTSCISATARHDASGCRAIFLPASASSVPAHRQGISRAAFAAAIVAGASDRPCPTAERHWMSPTTPSTCPISNPISAV
jgi:hypothetical protein